MKTYTKCLLTLCFTLAACAEEEKQPGTVNKQGAAASTDQTIGAINTVTKGTKPEDGQSSAGQLSSVAQQSQNLLQPASGSSTSQTKSALSLLDLAPLEGSSEGCKCTGTSCVFTACSPGGGAASGSSFTIDGSYSWGGGHIECKSLVYTFKGGGGGVTSDVKVTLNCDLTATPTSINGSMSSVGETSTELSGAGPLGGSFSSSSSWDIRMAFNNITFTANKATGGSLHVDGTSKVTSAGTTQAYEGSADVTFPVN